MQYKCEPHAEPKTCQDLFHICSTTCYYYVNSLLFYLLNRTVKIIVCSHCGPYCSHTSQKHFDYCVVSRRTNKHGRRQKTVTGVG